MACRDLSEGDLVIRGGTVATAGSSAGCDVAISQGRISQIGRGLRGHSRHRRGARPPGNGVPIPVAAGGREGHGPAKRPGHPA